MRAARLHGHKDLRIEQITEPICAPGTVKVRRTQVSLGKKSVLKKEIRYGRDSMEFVGAMSIAISSKA